MTNRRTFFDSMEDNTRGKTLKDQRGKRRGQLSEKACEILKERIEKGVLVEGESLCEQELACELKMSRTPVRRAMQKLEEEGLLTIVPRKGAFVNTLSIQEYRDVNDLRSVLEPLALETSISRIPAGVLSGQERTWTDIAAMLEKGDPLDRARLITLDEAFHEIIVTYCRNRRLKAVMNFIRRQVVQIRLFSWMNPRFFPETVGEHIRLIELVKAKDLPAAQLLLKRHILLKDKYIEPFIKK